MILSEPITISLPSITEPNGTVKNFRPITIHEFDVTIIDNIKKKRVVVEIKPIPSYLVLWENEAYDLAGDYTQSQVENRIMELLGDDPKSVLESLFYPIKR
jgi:hypothetical protein